MKWHRFSRLVLGGVCSAFFLGGCSPPAEPPASATSQPDLTVSSIQAPTGAQSTTDIWTLGATISNSGTADAGPSTIHYQISTKSTLDGSATTIGTSSIAGLAAGASTTDTWSTSYSIAEGGTHWVFVTVDSGSAVTESNEGNNNASAAVPVKHPEVIIETYLPKYGSPASVSTFVTLFGASGDVSTDAPDLWNTDAAPYTTETTEVAENGAAGLYGKIDYTGGLAPGTYYVRVRALVSYQQGAYAIRVLTAPESATRDATWPWFFTDTNQAETRPAGGSYETDDSPSQGGIPTSPAAITLNEKLNRWLEPGNIATGTPGDVDWFVLTLP